MRGKRKPWVAALLLGSATCLLANPFSFLFFWKKSAPREPGSDVLPGKTAEIKDLVSEPAQQKCDNWAWAAALETALHAQHVQLSQSYWVMRADGGEVCKDGPTDLEALGKLITGEYTLDDGRKVRLRANAVEGAPTEMDALIVAPMTGRPLIFFWKDHAYVYRGLRYNELVASNGEREFEVLAVELLDPFYDTAAKQGALFERDKDDPAEINGMLDVTVTPIEGTDWLHPEKELERPTEIFPQ